MTELLRYFIYSEHVFLSVKLSVPEYALTLSSQMPNSMIQSASICRQESVNIVKAHSSLARSSIRF